MIFSQARAPALQVGDVEPNVVFRRVDDTPVRLASFRGKVVVIEFTSYHCAACRAIEPLLDDFAKQHPQVVVVSVSVDPPADFAKLVALRRGHGEVVLVHDTYSQDRSKMAVWKFEDTATPGIYVIGTNGKMASRLMQGGDTLGHIAERVAWAKYH